MLRNAYCVLGNLRLYRPGGEYREHAGGLGAELQKFSIQDMKNEISVLPLSLMIV
jgi:hypothetical protein